MWSNLLDIGYYNLYIYAGNKNIAPKSWSTATVNLTFKEGRIRNIIVVYV
jgi:hypothetical protein